MFKFDHAKKENLLPMLSTMLIVDYMHLRASEVNVFCAEDGEMQRWIQDFWKGGGGGGGGGV